mgnify:CR=1 FL=1
MNSTCPPPQSKDRIEIGGVSQQADAMMKDESNIYAEKEHLVDVNGNQINVDNILETDEVLNAVAQNNDDENESQMQEKPELKHIPEHYKFSNPINVFELEWKVTLSRYDFPWREIALEPFNGNVQFSAKECYKMYTSIVTDVNSFLNRVLDSKGSKKTKYRKMI